MHHVSSNSLSIHAGVHYHFCALSRHSRFHVAQFNLDQSQRTIYIDMKLPLTKVINKLRFATSLVHKNNREVFSLLDAQQIIICSSMNQM